MSKLFVPLSLCAILSALTGCSGESEQSPLDSPPLLDDSAQCPVADSDFAEQLFTESDREWFCTVAGANPGMEDRLYFKRNGEAETSRFRNVYWNRSLQNHSINLASPFISPLVVANIFSANTVLTFELIRESGEVEAYDCILVGRETLTPGLI